MDKLKYVIFGLRNLLVETKDNEAEASFNPDSSTFQEFSKLVLFLKNKDIQPIVFANHEWSNKETKESMQVQLERYWGKTPFFITNNADMPRKPKAEAMGALLSKLQCKENEVLYIGNSDVDMQTAVNGKVVFINAVWFKQRCNYGFKFDNPKEIARFIDIFCRREHSWGFSIESGSLRYFSLAPYGFLGKYEELYGVYSKDARDTAKRALGHSDFWGKYLIATLLYCGLYKEIDYVCPFPSHRANLWKDPLKDSIDTFAKCFRISYLADLIVRHTDNIASHENRSMMNHLRHLNTIHLKQFPTKPNGKQYKSGPLGPSKTVLVVDDFCTEGYSLEVARTYLQATGAKVILLSWLKTVTKPFVEIADVQKYKFDPFKHVDWTRQQIGVKTHGFDSSISDKEAYLELKKKFEQYDSWSW